MRSLLSETLSETIYEDLFESVRQRAGEFYRGEVWSLRHVYGTLSRFINEPTDGRGKQLTPSVVTTWLNDAGTICCSSIGRSAHVEHHRSSPGEDTPCVHAATFLRSLSRLCTRIGVSVALFLSRVPALSSGEDQGGRVDRSLSSSKTHAEDWDAKGPIQTVRTGQSVVMAVVSGLV